jgi:glycosyltransferase involved in cell wall biosynthesis
MGGLRLLHIHNRYRSRNPSGETNRVFHDASLLRDAGHRVWLRTIDNDQISAWGPMKVSTLPLRTIWSSSSYAYVRRTIRELKPDVVHVHNTLPLASPSVFWAAHLAGAPVVHTLANYRLMCPAATFVRSGRRCEDCRGRGVAWPGVLHRCYRGSLSASTALAAMLAAHRRLRTWEQPVDVLLVGSEFARQKHIEGGFPADKLVIKPNTAPDPGRTRSGPGDHFLFAGRLDAEKNVGTLLEALALVERDARATEFRILGEGPERAHLERSVRRLGLRNVRFVGAVSREEVLKEMLRARAFLSPSIAYEVSPISIIEALSAGVPSIVARGGAQTELITHEETGFHVDPYDRDELASRIRQLEDDRRSERMGTVARSTYERRHSSPVIVAALEDAYGLAMERRRQRASR